MTATIRTSTKVLILQHPQEPDKEANSAVLLNRILANSMVRVGLSWRNLGHALGEEANPKEWLVLYLGSVKFEPTMRPASLQSVRRDGTVEGPIGSGAYKGIVLLDGTWSQAKTLWWRNAWLLKLQRAVVVPERPSLYGELRKEPRRESVSTLEAAGLALANLEGDESACRALETAFTEFLAGLRASGYKPRSPRMKRNRRRRRRQRG